MEKIYQESGGACLKSTENINEQLLTGRLWSPEVLKTIELRCVTFQYRLEGDTLTKLTLMRREMGLVEATFVRKSSTIFELCSLWLHINTYTCL